MNSVIILGLVLNLVASFLIAYGRIFRTEKTIHEESKTSGKVNVKEEHQRLLETRVAQAGVVILVIGFAVQIIGNVVFDK